jgi:type II secretory pathway pseudopilin PulG
VILILGIITLIGIPTISKIIKEAQKNAFKDSASNIIKAATFTNYYKEKGQSTIYNTKTDLDYTGKKYDGFVYIKSDDNVQINILDDKHNWCMYKGYGDTDLSLKENITSLEDCML